MEPKRPQDSSLPPILGEPENEEIHQIHRAILEREPHEPAEGEEPAPWWVWVASVIVIFSMGFYLGHYGGGFNTEPHVLFEKASIGGAAEVEPLPDGSIIYGGICMPCHQAGGTGTEGKYPPLAGSEWLAKDPSVAARIVLHGLRGPIQVKGKPYDSEMPALGNQLSDAEIAAVLSYVRSNFGNSLPAVEAKLVTEVRQAAGPLQGPWTVQTLTGAAK